MVMSRVLVNKEVASAFGIEPDHVKALFIELLDSFETRFPRLKELYMGDKANEKSPFEVPSYRRRIHPDMICAYTKSKEAGQVTYFVYMVTYRTTKHAMPMDLIPEEKREGFKAYYRLGDIPAGSLFETKAGVKAVKSEYYYSNGGQCQCVLLSSGEYAHFKDQDNEMVRLLSPREFS